MTQAAPIVFRTDAEQVARYDAARAVRTSEDERALKDARDRASTTEDIRAIEAIAMRFDVAGYVAAELPAHLRPSASLSPAQLHTGERLIDGSACACPQAGACACRVLPKAERIDTDDGRVDHRDAADLAASISFDTADAWLGKDERRDLQRKADLDFEQQRRLSAAVAVRDYRPIILATIAKARPDLAARAATESVDWLEVTYSALPLPPPPQTESKTDMADDLDTEFAAARRRSNAAMRDAWRNPSDPNIREVARLDAADDAEPDVNAVRRAAIRRDATAYLNTEDGATSLSPAAQQTRVDAANETLDRAEADALFRRMYKALRGHVVRTDAKGASKPKPRSAHDRALDTLQGYYDKAAAGTLDRSGALAAGKLLESLADLNEQAPDDGDDDEEKTDALDAELDADFVQAKRDAQTRMANAWRK